MGPVAAAPAPPQSEGPKLVEQLAPVAPPVKPAVLDLTPKALAMHNKIQQSEKAFELKEEKKAGTRRAAYNLLMRLKENDKRHKKFDKELISQLLAGDKEKVPTHLVDQLLEKGNDLDALSTSFSIAQEKEDYEINRASVEPVTERQLLDRYSKEDAAILMAQQERDGLAKPDSNLPGKKVRVAEREQAQTPICPFCVFREVGDRNSECSLAACRCLTRRRCRQASG